MAYKYLIVDSQGDAVAHGIAQQKPVGKNWCLRVEDGDLDQVMSQDIVDLVSSTGTDPGLQGRILRREGNLVFIEPLAPLGESARRSLRVPVRFVSYLYPVTGNWKGRVPIVSKDLSCGGLAFYCPRSLEKDEIVQVVIPVTSQPLVLTLRILRMRAHSEEDVFYAGCFQDMVREEENMMWEAVFSIQLSNH